jgi:phosphoglucomutase
MLRTELLDRIREFSDGADADMLRETVALLLEGLARDDGNAAIEDAFYRDLDFGTGGLRGVMGPGTNRMNRVMIARATQGLVNYVLSSPAGRDGSICIAHDSRLRSSEFAREAARVVAGNGLKAYLFEDLRPTPELSFAVRRLRATAGVVITASHNPKEYNGYKVYWSDGGQVVPPHDRGIIQQVREITGSDKIRLTDFADAVKLGKIEILGRKIDYEYLEAMDTCRLHHELCESRGGELKIVFTPLHGTGGTLVPRALERWGFSEVTMVPDQAEPDGYFPTVKSPNPEERAAMELGLALAREEAADLVMATDPDADRVGVAVAHGGDFVLLSGNQVAALLAYHVCESRKEQGRLPADGVIVKTIVTSELVAAVARDYGVEVEDCLTGFKYIGELIQRYEELGQPGDPVKTFLMGCEESYGYLVGTHARDKDAVVAACAMAELALWAKTRSKTLVDLLHELYLRHGVFVESQLSRQLPGIAGMQQIGGLMESLRNDPPAEIAGITVSALTDIENNVHRDLQTGATSPGPGLPESNVLIFELAEGSRVVARPSGTEPKIKFYFMVVDRQGFPLADKAELEQRIAQCSDKEQRLLKAFQDLTASRLA